MHIHWIANTIVPPPISLGGGDRIMVECIRRWSKQHTVTVYGNEGAKQLCDWYGLAGINHVTWRADHLKRFGMLIWWGAQTIKGMVGVSKINLLQKGEEHVVFSTSEFPANYLPALLLKRRNNLKLVTEIFLLAPKWFSSGSGPGWFYKAYRPLQLIMLRSALARSEMILVTGEEDRERLLSYGRDKKTIFPVLGGVDLSIPQSVPDPEQKTFDAVFIGRLHPQKGPLELIDIWQRLLKFRPGAKLAVIGSGPLEAACKFKVAKLGLLPFINFIGFCDGVEKYKIIKSARVVLHPASYDSGGMAAAEALCCGLPGVSFDLTSLRTYYPKGWLKAPVGDLETFAKYINDLLSDNELYKAKSKDAYEAGLEWDWNARADATWLAIQAGLNYLPNKNERLNT